MDSFKIGKRQFLREIIEDANSGRTFVPFIGSGLSSPSGIIMGMEFTSFLAFTTYLVLCDPKSRKPTHGEGQSRRWNLAIQGWPPLPSRSEAEEAERWISKQFERIYRKLGLRPNFDENHRIQSLERDNQSSLDNFVHAMRQPPIPLILRSWYAAEDEDRLRQLKNIFSSSDSNGVGFLSPAWKRNNQSFQDVVVESGIRALSDWRETLEFLCRIQIDNNDSETLRLGASNPSIIDDFNATITRDKRPSLGHKIVAHLSEPLRIFTLLTTNFDTLTEDAYRALSLPLTVLPVSARGDLPNPRTASSCDALIKLHGESHDTRADLSLDDEPSDEDKNTFLAYMRRGTGHLLHKRPENATQNRTSRLLVVGYSGNDHRCVQMIKHWLEHSGDDAKVYWICFSASDQKKVDRLFDSDSFRNKVRTVLTSRPDLLLYELHQRLQLSLPPGGLTYEFSHVLPPERLKPFDYPESQVEAVVAESKLEVDIGVLVAKHSRRMLRDATVMACRDATIEAIQGRRTIGGRSVLVSTKAWSSKYRFSDDDQGAEKADGKLVGRPTIINSSGGVVRACSLAASTLTSTFYKKVFWIELQDYPDTDSLLRDLLRSLALRCGQYQAKHITTHPISEGFGSVFGDKGKPEKAEELLDRLVNHFRAVLEEYRTDPNSVAILLNGRDSYGCGAGLVSSPWRTKKLYQQLHLLIESLGRTGIPTVYFPCTKSRSKRKLRLIHDLVVEAPVSGKKQGKAPQLWPLQDSWPSDLVMKNMSFPEADEKAEKMVEEMAHDLSVFNDIIKETLSEFYVIKTKTDGALSFGVRPDLPEHKFRKMEFLYALTLFRHSRHANAIGAEGAFSCPHRFQPRSVDNDFVRAIQVDRWSKDLCDNRVFFTKPGGALWMHRDIREAIHHVLETTDLEKITITGRRHANFRETRGRAHFWIGEWYHKAYCSSGHITPIIEAVYHLLSSAVYSQFAFPKRERGDDPTPSDLRWYRAMMFESAVVQASKLLLLSWQSIELWQASPARVAWLSKEHRKRILDVLGKVSNRILKLNKQGKRSKKKSGPKGKTREIAERLDRCSQQFAWIHKSLHDAVKLVGGRCKRAASSWSTPDSIMMRMAEGGVVKSPLKLDHGIDAIRLPETSKKGSDFWSATKKELDVQAHELWDTILEAAKGESEAREKFGKMKAKWKSDASTADFQDLIWFLSEAAYVCLRRAKLRFHANKDIDPETWLVSTICCNLGIDLCKHLPASNLRFEIGSKVKMHCIYAVGLANLGRFFEANRHLNDAQGLLSKWKNEAGEENAIISIRRAEVKLTECYWISCFLDEDIGLSNSPRIKIKGLGKHFALPSCDVGPTRVWSLESIKQLIDEHDASTKILPPNIFEAFRKSRPVGFDSKNKGAKREWRDKAQAELRQLMSAILDEAVRALEIAEKNLGGASQSSLWWSRLHTLRMRVYGFLRYLPDDAELCIIFRKQSADNGIFKSFLSVKRIAGEDDFRRLRALKYFLRANRWYCHHRAHEDFDKNRDPKDSKTLEKYLPKSLEEAKGLANELWTANKEKGKKDLLLKAIRNCFVEFEEVAPKDFKP